MVSLLSYINLFSSDDCDDGASLLLQSHREMPHGDFINQAQNAGWVANTYIFCES